MALIKNFSRSKVSRFLKNSNSGSAGHSLAEVALKLANGKLLVGLFH